jgi:hypothetical protein
MEILKYRVLLILPLPPHYRESATEPSPGVTENSRGCERQPFEINISDWHTQTPESKISCPKEVYSAESCTDHGRDRKYWCEESTPENRKSIVYFLCRISSDGIASSSYCLLPTYGGLLDDRIAENRQVTWAPRLRGRKQLTIGTTYTRVAWEKPSTRLSPRTQLLLSYPLLRSSVTATLLTNQICYDEPSSSRNSTYKSRVVPWISH